MRGRPGEHARKPNRVRDAPGSRPTGQNAGVTGTSDLAGPEVVPLATYEQRDGGWAAVPSVPAPTRRRDGRGTPTWVVLARRADLAPAARAWGADEMTVDLVEQRVRRLESAPPTTSKLAHVDHGRTGDVLLSIPTIWYDDDTRDVHTGDLTAVACGDLVLTVEQGSAHVLDIAAERLTTGAPTPDRGAREVLAGLLFTVLARASDVELGLGDAVARTERLVFTSGTSDPVERIYDLKREIAEARRGLSPVMAVLPELDDDEDRHAARTGQWLHRLQASVDRLDRHLDAHDSLLGAMLEVHLSQVSVRQNEDMRKISAWAAMIAVPTLIVGLYGMNFHHMPELSWTYGYPLAVTVMAGVCLWLYRAFKRSGWL